MILFTIKHEFSKDLFYKKILTDYIDTFQNLNFDCKIVSISHIPEENFESTDFIFCINSGRPQGIPSEVPWVSWFHDIHMNTPRDEFKHFTDEDIAYFIGVPSIFGVDESTISARSSVLLPSYTMVNSSEKDISFESKSLDVILIGYLPTNYQLTNFIPKNIMDESLVLERFNDENRIKHLYESSNVIGRHPFLRNLLIKVVNDNYQALSGTLDTSHITKQLCVTIDNYFGSSEIRKYYGNDRFHLDYYSTHLPRRFDRFKLADLAGKSSFSFQIIGKGWENENKFIDNYLGFINPKFINSELSKSRIILCNNTHGLSFNHRIIDAIMNDCIVFNHTTPHAGKLGTLENSLIPEIDFIQYDEVNLIKNIKELLKDESKMQLITKSAKSKILNSHTTTHRANQILNDLKSSCN